MLYSVIATGHSLSCDTMQCDAGTGAWPSAAISQNYANVLLLPEQLTNALAERLQVGLAYLTMMNAAVLALLVSLGLLWLYRRAVLKSMHARTNLRKTEPTSDVTLTPPSNPVRETTLDLYFVDRAPPNAVGPAAEALYSRILRAPWRAAAIYAGAGLCYALIMATAWLTSAEQWSTEFDRSLLRFLLLFWTFAWPVVLVVNIVAATTWRTRLAVTFGYFLILVAINAIVAAVAPENLSLEDFSALSLPFGGPELPSFQVPGLVFVWFQFNLEVTVLMLAFLYRRIRAVGPLVLAFMIIAVLGWFFAQPLALYSNEGLKGFLNTVRQTLGDAPVLYAINILGFVLTGLVVGWVILQWIRRRYEHKKASDQSITLDAIWLVYSVFLSVDLSFGGSEWLLAGPVAFAAYKGAALAGFRMLGRKDETGDNARLLLLRVFSLGKRSRRLFDALAKHWRYVGDIQMIAGPDLATTTVEPHEFLDFLTGKLARRFIDGPEALEQRISEMDLGPDRDGRFRVNDFFCHDDAWQMTLSRLVGDSDAVLMDLRGFSAQNAGVAYEINELINVVPLERVVFVVDDTTDEQFLEQTVQESWDRMTSTSPNRSSTLGRINLFRYSGSGAGELRQFLGALSGAARTTASAEVDGPAPIRWPVPTALVALFVALFVLVVVALVSGGTALFSRDLLYSDDFSVASGWPEESRNNVGSYYDSDSYRMYASAGSFELQLASEVGTIRDVKVQVNATLVSGQPSSTGAGVVCRATDSNNYYLFEVYYTGYAAIWKREDGKFLPLDDGRYAKTIGGKGTMLRIQGNCVGDTLTLYVDGQKVAKTRDSEFEAGKVGLLWDNYEKGAPRAEGSFNNFMVFAP